MIIGFGLVAAFVFTSGIRGVAWVSVVKDLLLLLAAVLLGLRCRTSTSAALAACSLP
jgi:SSS family solute:Na+ symporter